MKIMIFLLLIATPVFAAERKPANAETCFSRVYEIADGKSMHEGFSVRRKTSSLDETLTVIPLSADVMRALTEASAEKEKICLQGTRNDNYFYVFDARKSGK